MARILPMPKLSDTMEEGAIATWAKKEGDQVEEGDLLAEIETDKATMEYESPEEGFLLKILVGSGKRADVGAPMAIFGDKGEAFDLDALLQTVDTPVANNHTSSAKAPAVANTSVGRPAAPASAPASAPAPAPASASAQTHQAGRLRASPLAKKVAQDRGIDLSHVKGSGPHGRVVARDLEQAQNVRSLPAMGRVITGEDRIEPTSMMRRTIAKRLHAAKNDAPHFYLKRSVNMTRVNQWRARLNEEAKRDDQLVKVSVNDLIMLACAKALRRHPNVNASWEEDQIRHFGHVSVAMAVALPQGLVTPVVRHTDQLGVREIALQTKDLAKRARDGQLGNDEYAGGTFTVSNLGMMGIEEFTAIINPPQAAILAVGATVMTPWVNEAGEIAAQPRMTLTMSCDHRVVDGMVGAEFLQTLVSFIEDPAMMLT